MTIAILPGITVTIGDILKDANVRFKSAPAIGGIRPDFLIESPEGPSILIEARSQHPKVFDRIRAIRQANLYKKITNVDHVLIVAKDLNRSEPSKGIVSLKDMKDVVSKLVAETKPSTKTLSLSNTKKTILAAMPFSGTYDDTFYNAMSYAAKSVNAACKRIDEEDFTGDITDKIKKDIKQSHAIIADLSESNPNVLYEVGFAHALEKPTVHICSTPLGKLPFDVRNWNTISYSLGQTYDLRKKLATRLKAVLQKC